MGNQTASTDCVARLTQLYRAEFTKQFGAKGKVYRDWIKNDPEPGKLIVAAIAERKAAVLMRHLCNRRNPVAEAVFEKFAGIKMPQENSKRRWLIRSWVKSSDPPS